MAQRCQGLLQAEPLGQPQADLTVAAEITGGGQHQIAQARQASEGVGPRPEGHAQPGDFSQTPGDQGRTGIEPQRQSIAKAGGDGQHVLDRTADFSADQVVVGVNAQGRTMKGLHQAATHRLVMAGRHQSGGAAQGHLARKARTAEHAASQVGRHLGLNLVDHQAEFARALGTFKALGQPGQGHAHLAQLGQKAAHRRHRTSQYQQVLIGHGSPQGATDKAQARRQRDFGQIAGVDALRHQRLLLGRIAGPEADLMPALGRRIGRQGRAPGACAEDDELHGWAAAAAMLARRPATQAVWVPAWACSSCCWYSIWKLISARCTGGKPAR